MSQSRDPQELIPLIAKGDRQAFSEFYDRLSSLAYTFALRILRSKADAEDLVQEVFLQAWNQASSYDSHRGKPEAWIITMTKSRAIDKLRSHRRKDQRVPVLEDAARRKTEEAENAMDGTSWKLTLQGAISDLSEIQREALEMAYFEGKTHTEISEELGLPAGTVKTRIRDGLLKLRQQFAKSGTNL